jgi:hypothetical protein
MESNDGEALDLIREKSKRTRSQNPKSEIRGPKEARGPNSEAGTARAKLSAERWQAKIIFFGCFTRHLSGNAGGAE